MHPLRKVVVAALLATMAFGLVAGCSQLPTAPANSQQAQTTPGLRSTESDGLIGGVVSVVDGLVKLVFRTLSIVGNIGGSLTNGRWRIDVPAGAIDGNATVGIGVADNTSSSCQLQIYPLDKNHFLTPVRLTANCSAVPSDQLKNYVIYWFDPSTRIWVPVAGSTVDLNNKTVSAPLNHFSGYAVGPSGGRAGW